MDDSLELRMVLIDPGGSAPGASTTPGPPAQPKPVAPVGAGAGQTVTVGGVKMTAADVAALTGKSSAFAEAVGGAGMPAEPAGQARRRAKAARGVFPEGFSSRGEAERSSMFVVPDFASKGEAFGAEAKGGDWQAKLFGLAQQAASNPAGAARAAAAMLGPQGALVAAALTAAVAIGKVISDRIVDAIGRLGRVAQAGGSLGVALAGNQNRAAYAGSLGLAADAIEATPAPLRRETAAIARASAQVVDAFGKVTDAFVERGRQLAQFSPELAAAGARGTIRELGADIREAQALGPSLARLSDAQGELSATIREILLPLKRFLIESLTALIRLLEKPAEYLRQMLEIWEQVMNWLTSFWDKVKDYLPLPKEMKAVLDALLEAFRPKETVADDFFEQFMNLGVEDELTFQRRKGDDLKRARDQRLNVPVFSGM